MTLSISLASTERALSRDAHNARQGWSRRAACIITLRSDDAHSGVGEASPLPGFSPDTLTQCQAALAALEPRELPARLEPGQSARVELARASARLPRGVPAARAALESALLDLWSRVARKPAWALLLDDTALPRPRELAALLMAEPEQAVEEARHAHERGIRAFKLKIGRPGAIERELSAVASLRRELGPDVRLRLDANQSLSAAAALACLPRFAEHDVEYIEEPCARGDLPSLAALHAPLALDESLTQLAEEAAVTRELSALGVRALILKPTLLGGVSACYAWAEIAARIGAQVILSHAFEGPVGLALSAALALSLGSETSAHGLDLEGARLEHLKLPFLSSAHLEPWSAPGFGDWPSSI